MPHCMLLFPTIMESGLCGVLLHARTPLSWPELYSFDAWVRQKNLILLILVHTVAPKDKRLRPENPWKPPAEEKKKGKVKYNRCLSWSKTDTSVLQLGQLCLHMQFSWSCENSLLSELIHDINIVPPPPPTILKETTNQQWKTKTKPETLKQQPSAYLFQHLTKTKMPVAIQWCSL